MKNLSISLEELPWIPKLLIDYNKSLPKLQPLYQSPPTLQGLVDSSENLSKFDVKKELLLKVVAYNYPEMDKISTQELENINNLKNNSLTITTAHQPNLFLGPLYTITKAISTVKLASILNNSGKFKEKIVPIFVIGGEDHDREELLHCYLFGKKIEWNTSQKGSVGSLIIDESFTEVRNQYLEILGSNQEAQELKGIIEKAYRIGQTLSQAYAEVLRALLSSYGLIVLDINTPEVKWAMQDIFQDELELQIGLNQTKKAVEFLDDNYSVQARPMPYNLFELIHKERHRIDHVSNELLQKLQDSPESFSPNVILRPLMQEKTLFSIANIGGMAETAYWLELKNLFDYVKLPFPTIITRDILCPIDSKSMEIWTKEGLELKDFFINDEQFKKRIILNDSALDRDFRRVSSSLKNELLQLEPLIKSIDSSLVGSLLAEQTKLENAIQNLYQKALKAEKKNQENKINRLLKIKHKIAENHHLVERKENFGQYFVQYGSNWIQQMYEVANPLEFSIKLVCIEKTTSQGN